MKNCSKCGLLKPITDFHKKTKQKSGLNPSCKACVKINTARYYAENADAVKARVREREERLSPELKRARKREGYQRNKEAARARSRHWMAMNQEKRRAIVAKSAAKCKSHRTGYAKELYWRDVERSRQKVRYQQAVRRAAGAISLEWWQAIFDFIETGICLYCGNHGRKLTMDHWMPVSLGGKTEVGNLIPCCQPCNSRKGGKHPDDWKRILGWDKPPLPGTLTIEQILQCSREAYLEDVAA
jgi:5-methylcytosine-specific restriction endonuclease McrA